MFQISSLRHFYPERQGFSVDRKNGHEHYTFLHFLSAVDVRIGGELVRAKSGACIIYKAGTPQYFYASEPLVHDWIHFYDVPQGYFEKLGLHTDELYFPKRTDFITEITRAMETEYFQSEKNREELLDLKLRELFIRFSRAVYGEIAPSLEENRLEDLYELRRYMFSRLDERWTVEKMAQKVNVSQSRFYYLYKSAFGISPMNDLIAAKVVSAQNLLRSGTKSIGEVALTLGYENVTHFIRQFKQSTGVTPNEYRKRHGGK